MKFIENILVSLERENGIYTFPFIKQTKDSPYKVYWKQNIYFKNVEECKYLNNLFRLKCFLRALRNGVYNKKIPLYNLLKRISTQRKWVKLAKKLKWGKAWEYPIKTKKGDTFEWTSRI